MIKEVGRYILRVAVVRNSRPNEEQIELIPRIELTTLEDDYPFVLVRKQFPIKLSFTMTINKSQGQSLTNVGIDLRIPPFTHGQLYVAFSRSTNLQGTHVLHEPTLNSKDNLIENIIYPELLI